MSLKSKQIVIIGSSNMDLVTRTSRIPVAGETLIGNGFFMTPGGKGANQAVAAAKLSGKVIFVAKLGKDLFASQLLDNLRTANVNITHIEQIDDVPSGIAVIAIDGSGRNSIIVVPGANGKLSSADIDRAETDMANASVIVCQLEVPLETVEYAAEVARKNKIPFILDPAPARPLSNELLQKVYLLKPNETEAEALTGIKVADEISATDAADVLLGKGVENVIITLGRKGFLIADRQGRELIPEVAVDVVDTTSAGDTFTGALAFGLSFGKPLRQAALYANVAAALCVTKMGAQSSIPSRTEVDAFIKARNLHI